MATIDRAAVSAKLFTGAALAGIFWMYLKDTAQPLVEQHMGPFANQWELLQWVFPTTCLVIMVIAAAYLVYGGVQEERKAERRRV